MDFSGKAKATILKILARSIKRDVEFSGVLLNGRIISAITGTQTSVTLPYNKKYNTYYHTHTATAFSYEDVCPFHKAMPPSGVDLVSHVYTIRAHVIEYIFTPMGYYKITNPYFNTMDDLILSSLRLYFTMVGVLFYLRDNVSCEVKHDIQVYLSSVNTINIDLLPDRNSLLGKALGLAIDREFPLPARSYSVKQMMDVVRMFHGKKILEVSFSFW